MEQIRAFIAIAVPHDVIAQLAQFQDSRRAQMSEAGVANAVRWVRPHQFHLTLKFLNDIAADRVAAVEAAILRACRGVAPLQLHTTQAGCFPHTRNPRVIWVGVGGETDRLQVLQTALQSEVGALVEYSKVESFHPHLTLGRVKTTNRREARQIGSIIESTDIKWRGAWEAERIILMRSELSSRGSTYTELASVPLIGGH